jgi:hypothetical protein
MSALMLSALDDLQAVMFKWKSQKSVIKPTLKRRANGPNYWYRVHLVEDFGSDIANEFVTDHFNNINLDNCVKWVEKKLKDWPNCNRMAHDMWDFKHRKDAEKFITVFHLAWEQ